MVRSTTTGVALFPALSSEAEVMVAELTDDDTVNLETIRVETNRIADVSIS